MRGQNTISAQSMSNTQFAFLRSESLPNRSALQGWIDDLGFDLQLCPDLDLKSDQGFSPCVLEGDSDVGPELWPSTTAQAADGDDGILEMAGARDFCVSMAWRGSMKDCAAVMIISCALAKYCDAVISYEGEAPEPFENLLAAAAEALNEARKTR